MIIKELQGEVHLKIVYFGPALSGKTTNLEKIHEKISPKFRSDLTTIKTRDDRTLFFDFMQLNMGKINGLLPRFNLYTVPGQAYYQATRQLVLVGVDGIVFVADSQPDRMDDNIQAYFDLKKYLQEMEKSTNSIPVVLQCNKQDLDDAVLPEDIQKNLAANGLHCIPSSALNGSGVIETLNQIISNVGRMLEI
jgi:hypothetical protein